MAKGRAEPKMKSASSPLDRLVDWFIPAELAGADRETRQRARMLLFSQILGAFIGNTVPGALFLVDPTPGVPVAVLAASITGFWIFPFVLKAVGRYNLLAFLSIQNLIFCILWSCYYYGGVGSPTLAWVLTIPLLAFFYLGSAPTLRVLVVGLLAANFLGFYGLYMLGHAPVQDTPRASLQALGIVSTIAASLYVAMMSTYYARILASGVELENEMKEHLATAAELRRATAEAERAGVAKSEFVARMSHELRTPLNAVIGYSQMLIEDARDEGAEDLTDLAKIHGAGQHLLKLVDEVLDLSKIDAGKMELLTTTVPAGPFLGGVANSYRTAAEKSGNRLEVEIAPDLDAITCDTMKVQQALGQLIDNAVKFTTDGVVSVVVERREAEGGDQIVIQVRDTGIGISEGDLPVLFDYFNGAQDSSASKYGGAGLGLPLSLKLCRLMGGDITATSELGVGSCFTMTLPTVCQTTEAVVHDEDALGDLEVGPSTLKPAA
jgi:signal transduction histidine kinase